MEIAQYTSIAKDHSHVLEQFSLVLDGYSNFGSVSLLHNISKVFELCLSKVSIPEPLWPNCQFLFPEVTSAIKSQAIGCYLKEANSVRFEAINVTYNSSLFYGLKDRVNDLTSQNQTCGSSLSQCMQTSFFSRPNTKLALIFAAGFIATILVLTYSKNDADKRKEKS